MRHAATWTAVLERLEAGGRCALVAVAATTGSAPGRAGFLMAVPDAGDACGTVGGGELEREMIDLSRTLLATDELQPRMLERVHAGQEETGGGGMICGGSSRLVIAPLDAGDRDVVQEIVSAIADGRGGAARLGSDGLSTIGDAERVERPSLEQAGLAEWSFVLPLEVLDTAYVVGSGHVGLAVSKVLATLDFCVVTLDERPHVATRLANEWADEQLLCPFAEVGARIADGAHSWVLIMTPSHRADEVVLRQLVGRDLRYLGMLASAAKAAAILDRLRAEGVDEQLLARVRTPIGLPIGSHTPEEIAVSIAAEMIAVRRGRD